MTRASIGAPVTRAAIPWARVVIEGLVIVVSILLAFGIDAWWDELQERERERTYLVALRSEFAFTGEQQAEPLSRARARTRHAAEALIAQAQGAQRAPDDSLYWWMSGLSQQLEFDPPRAVLDDLISSGESHLIQSDSLRLALALFDALLEQLRHADEQAWTTWEQRIQPFLEGRVPRVDRLRRGTFGTLGELPFGPSPHPTDWTAVFGQRDFESMLAERWMRLSIAETRFDAVMRVTDAIVRLTDERLEDL